MLRKNIGILTFHIARKQPYPKTYRCIQSTARGVQGRKLCCLPLPLEATMPPNMLAPGLRGVQYSVRSVALQWKRGTQQKMAVVGKGTLMQAFGCHSQPSVLDYAPSVYEPGWRVVDSRGTPQSLKWKWVLRENHIENHIEGLKQKPWGWPL